MMSLDKAIRSGKERRKQYYGAKSFVRACRNHGTCERCRGNRNHRNKKALLTAEAIYEEWELNENEY